MVSQAQKIETRVFRSSETRVRVSNDESRTIRGYGIVFNSDSAVLYERGKRFVEVIRPEAVRDVDFSELKCMHNHSSNRLLGRVESGTMRYGIDTTGVWYENNTPNSPTGEDVLESVRRGDTDGSSFQFVVAPGGETWSVKNGIAYREITKIESVFEMGPVSEPAYPGTAEAGLSARSLEMLEEAESIEKREVDKNVMSWLVSETADMVSYANWLMNHCERAGEYAESFSKYDPENTDLYARLKSEAEAARQALKIIIGTEAEIMLSANSRRSTDGGAGLHIATQYFLNDLEIEAMQMDIL